MEIIIYIVILVLFINTPTKEQKNAEKIRKDLYESMKDNK